MPSGFFSFVLSLTANVLSQMFRAYIFMWNWFPARTETPKLGNQSFSNDVSIPQTGRLRHDYEVLSSFWNFFWAFSLNKLPSL
jgi:hypothetical protein